jgi:hypothetical protein
MKRLIENDEHRGAER